jgi:hypothetical protein
VHSGNSSEANETRFNSQRNATRFFHISFDSETKVFVAAEVLDNTFDVADYMIVLLSPLILLIGIFGNVVIFLVFMKVDTASRTKTRLHILALAVCDIIILTFGLLRRWLQLTVNIDPVGMASAVCKISAFITYYSAHCSAWVSVHICVCPCVAVMQ